MESQSRMASPTPPASNQDGDQMRASISAAREALTAQQSDTAWIRRVCVAFGALATDLRRQIATAEATDGIYPGIVGARPRLSNAVNGQIRAQQRLAEAVDDLLVYAHGNAGAIDVNHVRDAGWAVLTGLMGHRQADSDLLHEADESDMGGES